MQRQMCLFILSHLNLIALPCQSKSVKFQSYQPTCKPGQGNATHLWHGTVNYFCTLTSSDKRHNDSQRSTPRCCTPVRRRAVRQNTPFHCHYQPPRKHCLHHGLPVERQRALSCSFPHHRHSPLTSKLLDVH